MIKGIKLLWAMSSILLLSACTPTEAITEEEITASSSIESSVEFASVATDKEESKETEEFPSESVGSLAYSESAEPQSSVSLDGYALIDAYDEETYQDSQYDSISALLYEHRDEINRGSIAVLIEEEPPTTTYIEDLGANPRDVIDSTHKYDPYRRDSLL